MNAIRLQLFQGRVESRVRKLEAGQRYEVQTRSINLGVRGTVFRVQVEDGKTHGEVLEGEVVLSFAGQPDGDRRLTAGTGIALRDGAQSGAQAASVPLLPAPALAASSTSGRQRLLEPVPGAVRYRVQIARDEGHLETVYEELVDAPGFSVPDRLGAGFFHLRLTGLDAEGIEGLSGDQVIYLPAAARPAR